VQRLFKDKPPRLELLFGRSNAPVYFVTFNTHTRATLLAQPQVHDAFVKYSRRAADFRIGVGRYVIMPDHIHLFVCFGIGCTTTLSVWIKGLKRDLDRVLLSMGSKPLQFAGQKLSSFFCAAMRATPRNGNMYSRILCAPDLSLWPNTGHTPVKSCESIGHSL
jgi:hypothetical protein